jgi:protease-4
MTLDVDALIDRRRLKRQLQIWRVLAILLAVAALVAIGARIGVEGGDYVARITVSGVITEDKKRSEVLDDVAEDANAKALIVVINSPGGTVVGAEQLYAGLRAVAKKKPVVATMNTLATSAGYYVAVGADRIFAYEGSITASIGVIFQATDLTTLMGKLGIKVEAIKSGPVKASPNPFEPTTPEARAVIEALVKDTFAQFLGLVRERRKLSEEQVKTISDGRVVTGRQAKTLNLVDEIGGEDEALAWLRTEKKIDRRLKVRDVKPKTDDYDWADFLGSLIGGRRDIAGRLALDGLISLWHPALR